MPGAQTDRGPILFMDEYYTSPKWQRKRLEAMQYADFRCQLCNAKDMQLHVHHRPYDTFKDEPPNDLVVLCWECHEKFHKITPFDDIRGTCEGCGTLLFEEKGECPVCACTYLGFCESCGASRHETTPCPCKDNRRRKRLGELIEEHLLVLIRKGDWPGVRSTE